MASTERQIKPVDRLTGSLPYMPGDSRRHVVKIAELDVDGAGLEEGGGVQVVFQGAFGGDKRPTVDSLVDQFYGPAAHFCCRPCFAIVQMELGMAQGSQPIGPTHQVATPLGNEHELAGLLQDFQVNEGSIVLVQDATDAAQELDIMDPFDNDQQRF